MPETHFLLYLLPLLESKIGARTAVVCFGYVHVLPEVRKSSKQHSEAIKVIYLLSIEQLILYLAQLNLYLFWYEIRLNTDEA